MQEELQKMHRDWQQKGTVAAKHQSLTLTMQQLQMPGIDLQQRLGFARPISRISKCQRGQGLERDELMMRLHGDLTRNSDLLCRSDDLFLCLSRGHSRARQELALV